MRERGKDRVTHRRPSALRSFPLVGDWAGAINIRPPLLPLHPIPLPPQHRPQHLLPLQFLVTFSPIIGAGPKLWAPASNFARNWRIPGLPPPCLLPSPPFAASRPTTLDPIILRGRRQRRREEEEQEGGRKYFKRDFFFPNSTFSPSSDLVRPFVQAREGRGGK